MRVLGVKDRGPLSESGAVIVPDFHRGMEDDENRSLALGLLADTSQVPLHGVSSSGNNDVQNHELLLEDWPLDALGLLENTMHLPCS